ncbi:hypothetical protein [Corynebacterium cystitidis]|uniref:hypothetical protein n=1 Tax=Corynebacterium cystitidis TaxID=35757 RepID=UPI00211E8BC0|nr:hypothetical protein [Corynebacterium cystitidis]
MEPDFSRRGLAGVIALAGLVLVVSRFHIIAVTLVVIGVTAWFFWPRRDNPEIASLRTSLAIARADITDVLEAYDTLLHGTDTDSIANRTLYYAALAEPHSSDPAIEEFQLRVASARRFVTRIDAHLSDPSLSKASLERLLAVTDERAAELSMAWADAKRSARRLGPGR